MSTASCRIKFYFVSQKQSGVISKSEQSLQRDQLRSAIMFAITDPSVSISITQKKFNQNQLDHNPVQYVCVTDH